MGLISAISNAPGHVLKFSTAGGSYHRAAHVGGIKRASSDSRTITIIASDGTKDRVGDIVEPAGIELSRYRQNPVILWQHIPENPIASCSKINVEGGKLLAEVTFPPAGVSSLADTVRELVRSGVVSATSIGFSPIAPPEPLPGGGVRYPSIELLELSLVSVGANPNALVVTRSAAALPEFSPAHWCAAKRAELEQRALSLSYSNPYLKAPAPLAKPHHLSGDANSVTRRIAARLFPSLKQLDNVTMRIRQRLEDRRAALSRAGAAARWRS